MTGLSKGLLVVAILLLAPTDLLAQENFGLGGSGPGEVGFLNGNNGTGSFNASITFPGLIVNWVDQGAVTKVKKEGSSCHSSWAFSTTGALEAWVRIEKGHLPSLSEQQLVDCDTFQPAAGCDGGDAEAGLMYAMEHGLCLESAYPYTGRVGKCKVCPEHHAKPGRIFRIPKNDERSLMEQVERQPVAVMLDGSWYPSYRGGILSGACGKSLNASALVVGYGVEGSQGYWLLKNSLGPDWGEHGYFRLVMGKNQCGIAEAAVVPELK